MIRGREIANIWHSASAVCALSSGFGDPNLADFHHIPDHQHTVGEYGSLREQGHSNAQQILALLPPARLVRYLGDRCSVRSPAPVSRVRLPDMDQRDRMGEPSDLLYHWTRQPALQSRRPGRSNAYHRGNA